MERRKCTAFDETGRKRCGKRGWCTRVRTLSIQWDWLPLWCLGLAGVVFHHQPDGATVLHEHWVCTTCRQWMRLPDEDVDFIPGLVDINDRIVDDQPRPEFTLPGLPVDDG